MKGCYSIKLKPGAIPFAITSPRRVPIPLLKQTKAELERMVEEKVITPVLKPTEWCAPVVIVPKSDGNVSICVDLIELNKNVMRELHPLPKAEYSLNILTGAKIFSKLDANSGFWQIPLDKKSSYLTTFITPFGRFRFQRLPFGISSAPEHFQRRMSQMLEGIPGTICHMDDILIWGSTEEEHDQRLIEVCNRLMNSGMTLNAKKCIFSQTSIKFLGHIIDGQGIHPDPDKIAAIENYQPPTNKKELKQLLGMANYLARFVPNYSDILFPLTSMLSNKVTFVWEAPQEAAFQKMKKILSSDPVLMIFDPRKETTVTTDTSSYGLGATICQKETNCQANGRRSVIAYASRTLTPTESRYAQIEKEVLAVVWGCEKFRDYLTGMHFKIETDHKPLIPIFSKKNLDDLSPRLQRIKLRMMKFSYTIVHIPGKELFAADRLSRNPQKVPYKKRRIGSRN
ncbi:Retrovirus-related Pol polyprotein from transposon 17.6 [Araneus ventricosus]|uniref:Retrovirus-related Pol polyprotein from transposon 17.6 n=1 Tax=Araneus ventricosus TaxID=182803 RepID=A0A4Y2PKS7_ARAVE|nr:Retrovirus-related Pol polyprotein from transposon 17.6 [Araneus ventricosus]